jgi:signal transduction histidine kinase
MSTDMNKTAAGAPDELQSIVDAPLLASFTHQIINPLNGVVGTIDNLIDGTIAGQQRRDQRLKAVRGQLTHAIELVRNLAYLSQLSTDAGRQSLQEVGAISVLPQVVIEAALFFQEVAADKRMEILLVDKVTQYRVPGPRALLRQVFTNLFENAVKYGQPDSRVEVIPRIQRESGELIVDVVNKGPGFQNEEKQKIFERGYRGIAARDVVASGSGLGLYICSEILTVAFSATIEAEHSPRKRETTFRLRFKHSTIAERRG